MISINAIKPYRAVSERVFSNPRCVALYERLATSEHSTEAALRRFELMLKLDRKFNF
jgi:hypothetical protein